MLYPAVARLKLVKGIISCQPLRHANMNQTLQSGRKLVSVAVAIVDQFLPEAFRSVPS